MKLFVAGLLVATGLLGIHANAQANITGTEPLSFEVGGGYTSIHANSGPGLCGCFFMNGFDAQAGVYGSSHFSVLFDMGRTKRDNINGFGHNLTLSTYMVGGKYTVHRGHLFSPYGTLLIGLGGSSSNYAIDAKTIDLAYAAGGGLNVRITRHIDFRAAEAEYLVTHIPNGSNDRQNQYRLTSGFLFHFPIQR